MEAEEPSVLLRGRGAQTVESEEPSVLLRGRRAQTVEAEEPSVLMRGEELRQWRQRSLLSS